jgi:hypothetical protein
MHETLRILKEMDDPVFLPCPTCRKPLEIGDHCECWKEDHLASTLRLSGDIQEEYKVNGESGRAYRLAEIIKEWREELGI